MDASRLWVDESFAGCDKIPRLELVKIQARVLLPVLRALRTELGAERANQLVADALRGWSREISIRESARRYPAGPPKNSTQ
jgi:hypothetical protein